MRTPRLNPELRTRAVSNQSREMYALATVASMHARVAPVWPFGHFNTDETCSNKTKNKKHWNVQVGWSQDFAPCISVKSTTIPEMDTEDTTFFFTKKEQAQP